MPSNMADFHVIVCCKTAILAIGKKKTEKKNQAFNRIRTRDLCDADEMLYAMKPQIESDVN